MTKHLNCEQVAKAEEQQHVDLKVTSKKIRAEQEKELKTFREGLKQVSRYETFVHSDAETTCKLHFRNT